ncbi:beta-propeller fold lactonase family protein [Cysteiniphilum halobium]|uniref:beta-propeller fold lactonase family protein n=1 Tax=Cysteiniphilum halobium TaxID=2219059 RepID=UPI003F8600E5
MYTQKKHFFIIILPCLVTLFSGCGGGGSGNQASGTTLVANIPKNISENASVSGSVELKNLNDFNAKDLDSLKITDSVSGAKNCKQTIILTYEHNIVANTLYRIAMKAPDEAPCQHKLSFSINDKPISTSEINVVVPYITGKVVKGLPPSTQAGAVYPVTFEFKNTNPNHSATGVTISPPPSDFTETTNTCKISNATLAPNSTCVIQGNFSPQIGKSAQLSYTLSYTQASSVTLTTNTTVSPRLFILSNSGAVIHYNLDKDNSLVNPQLSTLFASPTGITLTETKNGSKAFIVNSGNNTVSQCDVNTTIGTFSNCQNSGGSGFDQPSAITLTKGGSKAFIVNYNNTVSQCDVNTTTGTFSNCQDAHATGLTLPTGITLTADDKKAYIINTTEPAGNGIVIHCDVNPKTGIFSNCQDAHATGLTLPTGITLTKGGSKAFIVNSGNNTVSQCDVNTTTGTFSNCQDAKATGLTSPDGITLTADGKKAFIANSGNDDAYSPAVPPSVTECDVNTTTDAFSKCQKIDVRGFDGQSAITLTADGKKAFMVNYGNNTVRQCDVNTTTDSFSNCTYVVDLSPASGSTGMALTTNGSKVFITNSDNNTISQCDVSKDGMFSNCQDTGNIKFDGPSAITLTADGSRAFIANAGIKKGDNGKVSRCDVSDTGVLSHCQDAGGSKFDKPTAITLTKDGLKAFIANQSNNTISQCDVKNGMFSNCQDAGDSEFDGPTAIVLTTDGSKAFIVNSDNNTVSQCNVNSTGMLSSCKNAGGEFYKPTAIILTANDSRAFIANSLNNNISQCDVKDGMFSNCKATEAVFSSLYFNSKIALALR